MLEHLIKTSWDEGKKSVIPMATIGGRSLSELINKASLDIDRDQDSAFINWLGKQLLTHPEFRELFRKRVVLNKQLTVEPMHRVDDMGVKRFNVGLQTVVRYVFEYHSPSLKERIKFFILDLKLWWRDRRK